MPAVDSPPRTRVGAFRERVRALPGGRLGWRIAITIAGVAVIAIGIVLLPLPGPGWLIIFAGLGLLATEYEWAARLLRWMKQHVVRWTRWAAAQPLWVRLVGGFVSLVLLVGVIAGAAWLVWE
jgi:uncharacterized protein (TIGR02611 family)